MPMYEKGSVRAEPRSKQQERMKKTMKKFLSSLLALTMILSLVVVPANATTTDSEDYDFSGGVSVTADKKSVESGSNTVNLTATSNLTVTKKSDSSAVTPTLEYSWSEGAAQDNTATNKATVSNLTTTNASEEKTYTCTVTYKVDNTAIAERSGSVKITVTNAQKAFEDAVKRGKVTYKGRDYSIESNKSVAIDLFNEDSLPTTGNGIPTISSVPGYSGTTLSYEDSKWIAKCTKDTTELSCELSITATKVNPTITMRADNSAVTANGTVNAVTGQEVALAATYSNASKNNASYSWTAGSLSTGTASTYNFKATTAGDYNVTLKVSEGDDKDVATFSFTIKVAKDVLEGRASGETSKTLVTGGTWTIKTPYIYNKDGATENQKVITVNANDVSWESSNSRIATVTNGVVTAGDKSGTATITATIAYNTKKYPVEYKVTVKALDVDLGSIANGDYESYTDTEFARILASKIDDVTDNGFKASDVTSVKLLSSDSYLEFTKDEKNGSKTKDLFQDFRINATKGYLGEQTFKVSVNDKYTVTLTVKVKGAGSEIKDTVTGTASNKDVTFTNSDYKYLYYTTSKVNDNYNDCFNGNPVTGWNKADKNKDVTVKASEFDKNGKVTLNVVGVDGDGYASTGTITVSQKSYDINYNVVAGKSVSFSQKDFEDFLEDYAEDNGNYNPKKDEITFDHAVLTSSIPSAKSEGTLYYGSTEITSSNKSKTDMTDMDKVSFDSVSKPSKGTVTLTFRVYGEIEKPNSRKPDKVNYDVNVVISVVKEDITYTVGIDDTVQLTARDFVNFLQDAKTSYRKSTLDYVKFDVSGKNVSSYAYGGLYRSYSSYSTGKLADSTDKFYYEPSRTQYDLADVAYHTTRWAEAGKTVYIPFTVYGTKNEEASGTMAITIAQTMNFTDVKPGDFFYEPVKWAVNNKITNGTSSTTFSPYKNCNRAEIVTFLWRAAGTPEPTSTRNPFTDVNSVRDASYYKAILWASQKGITAGTTATTFSPYQECTRSQIVTFLYRYAGKPSGNYTNPFKDVSSVNEASYYNAILWAVGKGITQGTSTTTFSPYASCTRGEAVTFLYRYVNGVK